MGCVNSKGNTEKKSIRCIILGLQGSGKSTFCKQLRLMFNKQYSNEERVLYTRALRVNLVHGLKELCSKYSIANKIKNINLLNCDIEEDMVEEIKDVWNKVSDKTSTEIENIKYAIDNIDKLIDPDYLATDDDILRARQYTSGKDELIIETQNKTWVFMDAGGQPSERRKWENFYHDLRAVIYVCAANEWDVSCQASYNPYLGVTVDPTVSPRTTKSVGDDVGSEEKLTDSQDTEYSDKTLFEESLELFEKLHSDSKIDQAPFIVFLNKVDLFHKNFNLKRFRKRFPKFKGSTSDEALEYLKERFIVIGADSSNTRANTVCMLDTEEVKEITKGVISFLIENS
ncbi:Guanine nucleotide-binding protein alpha subunit [Orpheovirus IHUMI-LCC2]|uniref:Guanine nucleotide-binding protein alpha subunit n=1 Tax=Orpheovirus IHUMI-LCC2 TaxID=2023057 RepID=A0A2I2L5N2_9VIRU|nr:Guanine nucleotide-binding protein alpha subunit [Orpheovirus IHUMI-LCC2]SNW62858.1 Guanine nucleotide-binding protein alpha subunit [Orpheovirus IHUMI-LCC2]